MGDFSEHAKWVELPTRVLLAPAGDDVAPTHANRHPGDDA